MKPSIWGWVLAAALALAGAGCDCTTNFQHGIHYRVTVVKALPVVPAIPDNPNPVWPPCSDVTPAMPPSLMAGDSFVLVGQGDHDEGPPGMCDEGSLIAEPKTPAWFATDGLGGCEGTSCSGNVMGCPAQAQFHASREGGSVFSISWQQTCGDPFRCLERYAVTYNRLVPRS